MRKILLAVAGMALASSSVAQTSDISPQIVSQVQTSLAARGFSPGPADGRMTAQTSEALMQLQRSRSLPATGTINEPTLSALGIGTAQNATVAPGATTVPNATASVTPNTVTAPAAGMPGTASPGTAPPGTNSLGGTPAGAPSPSFGATPVGAPSTSFTPTPAGAPSPSFGATAPGAPASSTTATTATPPAVPAARSGR